MTDDSRFPGVEPSDSQFLRWLQHPLVDVNEISLRQSLIETICSEKALMDTLQKGSGMLRSLPGESETNAFMQKSCPTVIIQQRCCRSLLIMHHINTCRGPWLHLPTSNGLPCCAHVATLVPLFFSMNVS